MIDITLYICHIHYKNTHKVQYEGNHLVPVPSRIFIFLFINFIGDGTNFF